MIMKTWPKRGTPSTTELADRGPPARLCKPAAAGVANPRMHSAATAAVTRLRRTGTSRWSKDRRRSRHFSRTQPRRSTVFAQHRVGTGCRPTTGACPCSSRHPRPAVLGLADGELPSGTLRRPEDVHRGVYALGLELRTGVLL